MPNNGNRSGNQSQPNHATRNQPLQSASQNSCPQQTAAKQLDANVPRVNMAVTCPETNEANLCSFATNQNLDSPEDCRVLANDGNREIVNLKTYYQICLVEIAGKTVRIVLDSAGGRSVITEDLCEELNLEVFASQNLNIGGPFGSSSSSASKKIVCANLKSTVTDESVSMMFSVVPNLGPLRMAVIPNEAREQLKNKGFKLVDADETNCSQYPVKIIIGLDCYGSIWKGMEIPVTKDIHVRESVFGWVAFGVTSTNDAEAFQEINAKCPNIDAQVQVLKSQPEKEPLQPEPVSLCYTSQLALEVTSPKLEPKISNKTANPGRKAAKSQSRRTQLSAYKKTVQFLHQHPKMLQLAVLMCLIFASILMIHYNHYNQSLGLRQPYATPTSRPAPMFPQLGAPLPQMATT